MFPRLAYSDSRKSSSVIITVINCWSLSADTERSIWWRAHRWRGLHSVLHFPDRQLPWVPQVLRQEARGPTTSLGELVSNPLPVKGMLTPGYAVWESVRGNLASEECAVRAVGCLQDENSLVSTGVSVCLCLVHVTWASSHGNYLELELCWFQAFHWGDYKTAFLSLMITKFSSLKGH